MPDFTAYFGANTRIDAAMRAIDTWYWISDEPTDIIIKKTVQAQTVRIEYDSRTSEMEGAAGRAAKQTCIVYGVKGHPSVNVPDTVIDSDDSFALDVAGKKVIFVVQRITPLPGQIQVFCESM